jgi:hypothetical protein
MDREVLNDTELINLVRETLNQLETRDESNKSVALLAEFAKELLKQRVFTRVEFLRLLAPKK